MGFKASPHTEPVIGVQAHAKPANPVPTAQSTIAAKKVTVVPLDLATSHAALELTQGQDDFTKGMINAVNGMLLDMLAMVARRDYEDRRRQAEGIENAKARDFYKGIHFDQALHNRIKECLDAGKSLRKTAEIAGCAVSTVQRVKAA